MQRELEQAIAELILGPAIDPTDRRAVSAWLEQSGVTGADAEAIRQSGIERLLVYRDLVRHSLRDVITTMLPRTIARLGTLAFEKSFDRFVAEHPPHTHYLRDVTHDFVAHEVPHWRDDPGIGAYLADLARHEALEYEIAARKDESAAGSAELDLDRPVAFIEACALMRYEHAVHELPSDVRDRSLPVARPTTLLAYRDAEHAVRFMELTPLASATVARLLAGRTLREAVTEGAADLGVARDSAVIDGMSRLLSDLAARGILLGTR